MSNNDSLAAAGVPTAPPLWLRPYLSPEELLTLSNGELTCGDYGRLGDNDLWALLTWMAAAVDWIV